MYRHVYAEVYKSKLSTFESCPSVNKIFSKYLHKLVTHRSEPDYMECTYVCVCDSWQHC